MTPRGKSPAAANNGGWSIDTSVSSVSPTIAQRYAQIENDAEGWSVRLVNFASDQRGDRSDLAVVLHRENGWFDFAKRLNHGTKLKNDAIYHSNIHHISACQTIRTQSGQNTLWAGRLAWPERPGQSETGAADSDAVPVVDFGSLPSVLAMGTGKTHLVLGYDTEYNVAVDGKSREIVSYQFYWVDILDGSQHEVVIMPLEGQRLEVADCLYTVSLAGGFHRYANGFKDVGKVGTASLDPRGVPRRDLDDDHVRDSLFHKFSVRIVLVGHYMKVDATAFRRPKRRCDDILHRLTSAGGGLVSLGSVRVVRTSGYGSSSRLFPFSVIFRDTRNQASPDHKSLEALGDACGVRKLDVGDDIADMKKLSRDDLQRFLDYSANDARIVVHYMAKVWGWNVVPPVTISSGGAAALKSGIMDYWVLKHFINADAVHDAVEESPNGASNALFRRNFQGLKKRKTELECDDDLQYYARRSLEPVDGDARDAHGNWADAFCGGYNACLAPGAHFYKTYDWDLKSAYPTAMSCIIDPDYSDGGVIARTIEKRELTLDDFWLGPLTPFVGHVGWVFPESVIVPCLPVRRGDSLIFPRTSYGCGFGDDEGDSLRLDECGLDPDGVDRGGRDFTREQLNAIVDVVGGGEDGVFHGQTCSAPEIWLALKLGARVFCQRGIEMKLLGREIDGEIEYSRSLRFGLKQMVRDRATAKRDFGPKSLEELTIKVATNSCYGKLAQDVDDQNGWNAYAEEMENIGGSAVTSPYHASMTTSLVRATLLAVANQVEILSATTDGVITSHGDLESLDLFGLADILRDARLALADDDSIWEIKHEQHDLINLATRANVSLEEGGVLAKGGVKTPKR